MIKVHHCLSLLFACTVLACSHTPNKPPPAQDGPPVKPIPPTEIKEIKEPKPKHEPYSKYGNPDSYVVLGKKYEVMDTHLGYEQTGTASWYGTKFHGQLTSSREPYDMYGMTAAHKHLPIPSYARVTNLDNGKSIIVRINDRGPFAHDRIIDLSYAAATKLDMLGKGTARVKVESIDTRGHEPQPPGIKNTDKVYLQVATFSERRNAEILASQIKRKSDAMVEVSKHSSGYRVYVGPFRHESEAQAFRHKIADMKLGQSLVVRR
jgi:rare lipoprotein A